jgi:hypothetical protein
MKDLEVQTYNFSVDGISLVKSLEKEHPELVNAELKQTIGNVSLKFMDAVSAKENEDFANNLRTCLSETKKSVEFLNAIEGIQNEQTSAHKDKMIRDSKIIIEKLENIISKLIY